MCCRRGIAGSDSWRMANCEPLRTNDERVDDRPCIIAVMHGHVTLHHCKLAQLISINMRCVTTILIIKKAYLSKAQNVKVRLHAMNMEEKLK